MNTETLQNEILRSLRDAGGHPLQEDVLLLQVKARVRPYPTPEAIVEQMQKLEGVNFIARMVNELDETNPFWLLDERGSAHVIRKRL